MREMKPGVTHSVECLNYRVPLICLDPQTLLSSDKRAVHSYLKFLEQEHQLCLKWKVNIDLITLINQTRHADDTTSADMAHRCGHQAF